MSRPAKAAVWFTVCYVIQRGMQFLSMPILTRLMSADDYGVYTLFQSWFNVLCVIASWNIFAGAFSKALVKYGKSKDAYTSSALTFTTVLTLCFSVIVLLFHKQISEYIGFSSTLQLLMCANLLLFPALQFWSYRQRFEYRYRAMVAITFLNSVVGLIVGCVAVLLSEDKSTAVIAGTVGVQCAICAVLYILQLFRGRTFFNKGYWKWTARLSLPLLPHYLSEMLLSHSDRIMISFLQGVAQAGIYAIVYQISMAVSLIRQGINSTFIPWFYQALEDKRYEEIRKLTNGITVLLCAFTLVFNLMAPELLFIAAPASYQVGLPAMPAVMCACFYIFLYSLFVNFEIYYEKPSYAAIASVAAALLNIMLNALVIPVFGFVSAGYTTMFSYGFMVILHYLFFRKITKDNRSVATCIDVRFLIIMSIALSVACLLVLLIYDYLLARMSILVIFLAIAILKRKKIMAIIKLA